MFFFLECYGLQDAACIYISMIYTQYRKDNRDSALYLKLACFRHLVAATDGSYHRKIYSVFGTQDSFGANQHNTHVKNPINGATSKYVISNVKTRRM